MSAVQAHRRGITDEMDLVAARGKLDAQFGGDDAGAAVGWITGDSDFHALWPCAPTTGKSRSLVDALLGMTAGEEEVGGWNAPPMLR